jgi:hypothetical protein
MAMVGVFVAIQFELNVNLGYSTLVTSSMLWTGNPFEIARVTRLERDPDERPVRVNPCPL